MQVNRESNLNINMPLESVSNKGLVTPSPLEQSDKTETLKKAEKSNKGFTTQSVDNGLSDEKNVQNELSIGSVDFEDTEKCDLMAELRDLKAPGTEDDADLHVNDAVKLKQEKKTTLVEPQTSEIQMENPTLLDLDDLLPPELPPLTPLAEDLLELPLLTDLRTETKIETKIETKTEIKQPSWTKNNLSSLVQAQFKKQLTAWDASGILNTRAKQSKALVSQAQKLSTEILNTPGYKEMFFEKSDTELRDALADAVGKLKKNDPKFKQLKEVTYQSLPKDKQAFVDAILTGLKAGLPKEIQNSAKLLNRLDKPEDVTTQQLLNKSELMGAIEKRRDQKMSPEGLKTLEKLDKSRQEKDLKSAQNQIQTENQKLEQETVEKKISKPVLSTELSEKELKDLITHHFKPGQSNYSVEEVEHAKGVALDLMKNTKDQKLLWTVVLRPEQDMVDELNQVLHGTDCPEGDQYDYSEQIYKSLRSEALKQLEATGSVLKRDKDALPKEVQFNGKTYTHVKQLGKGGFGVAHLFETTNKQTQQTEQVVVKQFIRGESDAKEWFGKMQKEIRAHQYAMGPNGKGHENVLALKGVLFDSKSEGLGEFLTVTEVASKGELKDVSAKIDDALKNKALTPTTHQLLKRSLLAKTMEGMKYVQSQRDMLHLDLKPENVFVTAQGDVKIADFGISQTKNTAGILEKGGSPLYMSPENAAKFSKFDNNSLIDANAGSDVWSLGVMTRELLTGNKLSIGLQNQGVNLDNLKNVAQIIDDTALFANNDKNRIYQKGSKEARLDQEKKADVKKSGGLSSLFKSSSPKKTANSSQYEVKSLGAYEKVINAMMHPDQDKRPTLEALTQHGLFADQILQEPKLQELLMAVLDNKDAKTIQKLSQEVESLNKRL